MESRGRCCNYYNSDTQSSASPASQYDGYFKPNSSPDYSKEIEVNCVDIYDAKCVGIIAEKIYDCVYLDNVQYAEKNEVFTIDNYDPENGDQYRVGDPITIDNIALCYDFLGEEDDDTANGTKDLGCGNILVKFDMDYAVLSAVPGNGQEACYYPDDEREKCPCPTVKLYTEFQGTVAKNVCNREVGYSIPKTRVFKQGVRFFASNLKVKIKGKIGNEPFTATKDYMCYGDVFGEGPTYSVNPVELTKRNTQSDCVCTGTDVGLNFTPVNLYGKISSPINQPFTTNIKYDIGLKADSIDTEDRYGDYGEGYINADVGYSFFLKYIIRNSTSEQLAVFTSPRGVECRNANGEAEPDSRSNGNNNGNSYRKCCRCRG